MERSAREAFPSAASLPLPAGPAGGVVVAVVVVVVVVVVVAAQGLRPPKCRLGERSVAPRSRSEPLGRSSSSPGSRRGCGGAAAGGERETASKAPPRVARERKGGERAREGGEARASPPASPPRGRLSAGGYRGGTVPCCRARARPRASGTGVPTPSSLGPPPPLPLPSRSLGARRGRRRSSRLSPPRPSRAAAARPVLPRGAVSAACVLPFFGPRLRDGALRSPGVRAGDKAGPSSARRRRPAKLWACDLRSDVATR